MNITNLDFLRNLDPKNLPGDFGAKIYEALKSVQLGVSNIEEQGNYNAAGAPAAPPPLDKLSVTGQNGHFNIAITHNQPVYRGIKYAAEYDTTSAFNNPQTVDMGIARNHNIFLGNGTYYWRAYSYYDSSAPSAPAYHGSGPAPVPVSGGGSISGPQFQISEGTGTGPQRQGLVGPGIIPFRPVNGAPPIRSS